MALEREPDGKHRRDEPDHRSAARDIGRSQSHRFINDRDNRRLQEDTLSKLVDRHQEARPGDRTWVLVDFVREDRDRVILLARGEILVWDADVSQAVAVVGGNGSLVVDDLVTPRVRRLRLGAKAGTPDSRGVELQQAVAAIRDHGIRVSASHVLPFSWWLFKASASPKPSPLVLQPRPNGSTRGAGITVAVIDTGLDDAASVRTDHWLAGITGEVDPGSLDGDPMLGPAGGHGTFVSGIVRQVAPGCTIKVYRALDADGIGGEVQVAQAILQAAAEGADVINLSLGGATLFGDPPLAIEDALANIPQRILVVAAAGNDGSFTPSWPAAFKRVVSVGALECDMTPAPYSNRGPWVDVSTVGTGAISTFVTGTELDGDVYSGDSPCAVWSGTSFAAPQVAGLLAVMLADGIEPLSAVPALLAVGQPMPNFGSTLRILDW
jgi:subtilisin family serine protease